MGTLMQGRSTTDISDQTGRGRVEEIKSIDGAACVTTMDAAGNQVGGAFTPADTGYDLTAAVAAATQVLTVNTGYVHFDVVTTAVRIKFGTAAITDVTATTGTRIQAGQSKTFQVPIGADRFSFLRDGAADGSINVTES